MPYADKNKSLFEVKETMTIIKIVDLNEIKGYFDGDSDNIKQKNKAYFLGSAKGGIKIDDTIERHWHYHDAYRFPGIFVYTVAVIRNLFLLYKSLYQRNDSIL